LSVVLLTFSHLNYFTMKKICCFAFLCLFATSVFAQSSFYLSAQGGPSFAFSNSNSPFRSSSKRLTANYGVGFGYEFPNQLIKAETGLYRTNIYTVFGLNNSTRNYGDDQVYLVRDSWQIPLRLKLKFWQPNDKITFRAITGIVLSLTPDDFKLKGDVNVINVDDSYSGTYFQTPSSSQQNTSFLLYGYEVGRVESNWLIESGLEMSCQLTNKLSGMIGLVYQGGLQNKYGALIYTIYYDAETGKSYYSSEDVASSQAKALNLNFGLAYAFGK
jgi:hypothetical protein